MGRRCARGRFTQSTSIEQASESFEKAIRRNPLPGLDLLYIPSEASVYPGCDFAGGNHTLTVGSWNSPYHYGYRVFDSRGKLASAFEVKLRMKETIITFEAWVELRGFLSGRRAASDLLDRLGTKSLQATAYFGDWLDIPIERSKVVLQ